MAAAKRSPWRWRRPGSRPHFVQGRRFTDEPTLAIVARVLAEEINADIERHINKFGGRASGLHHKTHQCLFGRKLWLENGPGGPVDLGRVGEVKAVDVLPIENLCLAGVVPVLPSLAEDQDAEGQLLNVNADTAAAAVAQALQAEKLVFLTDTAGILADKNEPNSLIRGLTPTECHELIATGRDRQGDDPQGRGLPHQPGIRRPARPTSLTADCATRCFSRSSPRAAPAPRSSAARTVTPLRLTGLVLEKP